LTQLTRGLTGKLTLIAAPAGFGKSTLLAQWIGAMAEGQLAIAPDAHSPTFCWLTLETADNDPIRFWLYFMAALQTKHPALSAATTVLLQSPEPPPIETILTIFLNELDAWAAATTPAITPAIVFILEDYHVITTPAIQQSLAFLLDHLPPTLHLMIATRADPPLPLGRLRTRGELTEIRADDLRFTETEAALFLNERMGLQLAPAAVHLLATRTEGWIVGLQLAALSMHGQEDKGAFLHSFSGSHRYILNYLIEEVLNQQPPAIQTFLLYTSILSRLCAALCDAVIGAEPAAGTDAPGAPKSQALLEQIAQTNLFLVSLDELGQWYRYHQLFAEVLQYRLRQRQPTHLATLHRRASAWYAQQEYLADAIHHALLAEAFAEAAELIERIWPVLWEQGAIATLFTWMQALPANSAATLWGRPTLYVSYAWGLALTGQIAAAEAVLPQVEATLRQAAGDAGASPHSLLGRAVALRSMIAARRGLPTAAATLAEQALTLIPTDAPTRGDAYYALGLAQQQQGRLAAAFHAYEAAAQLSIAANHSFLAIAARYHEARILMAQGALQQAATIYRQMLSVAAQAKKQLPVIGLVHVGYGELLYQWHDLPAAAQQVETGLAFSPRRDITYTDGPLHRFSILARIRQAGGDQPGALAAVASAKAVAQQTGIALDVERAAALEALIQLRLDDYRPAAQWAEGYAQRHSPAEQNAYLHEFETLVFVRLLLTQGRANEALTRLAEWIPTVEAAQRQGSVIELYALQTLALRLADQAEQARDALTQALTLAAPEGYIRLFVDEGEPMRLALLEFRSYQEKHWLAEQPDSPQPDLLVYSDKLLNAFTAPLSLPDESSSTVTTENGKRKTDPPKLFEPLTDREIEVLRLVAAGLSNAAIAEQLVVSVGTVKTHLKHIFGKLAVESRTQAVAQARALELF
jgi:LuxR family maltose regulon positive regulatory protein